MLTDYLEFTINKFTAKIATDRFYTVEGVWAKAAGNRVDVGISDFLQQRSGDMAFVEVKPAGSQVKAGEELVILETIKLNISLVSPVTGTILKTNPDMQNAPEVINQDPYQKGWVAVIEADHWEADHANLLDAQSYFAQVKNQAEQEAK